MQRWFNAPWWALSLVQGALFTIVFATGTALADHGSFVAELPSALIAGVVFGALMGPATARRREDLFAGLPTASPQQREAGVRAARQGRAPKDPEVRRIAVHVAEQRLATALRGHRRQLLIFGLGTAGYLVASLVWSWWWVIGAVVFLGFFVLSVREPRRWLRRLAALTHH